jgi:hypothetical protein
MKEQLVSFETAVLAKEKGFDPIPQGIYTKYYSKTDEYELLIFKRSVTSVRNDDIKVVTQSLLQKWLREKHKIYIELQIGDSLIHESWCWKIFTHRPNGKGLIWITADSNDVYYNTYEEALEKGLQEALKLIDL